VDFFKFWFGLPTADLVRLLLPAVLLTLATFLPGRRVARVASFGVAITVPLMGELGTPWPLTAGWSLLWLAVAWQVGKEGAEPAPRRRPRAGGIESGTVGLMLGVALMLLLVASLARQDLAPEVGRCVFYGLFIVSLGVLHLMLRRHVRRAAIAFAALGLGLQMLDSAARASQIEGAAPPNGAVWLASAIAVTLVLKVGVSRERFTGTAWVSDAHDLHD
jgi:hypothetical protein